MRKRGEQSWKGKSVDKNKIYGEKNFFLLFKSFAYWQISCRAVWEFYFREVNKISPLPFDSIPFAPGNRHVNNFTNCHTPAWGREKNILIKRRKQIDERVALLDSENLINFARVCRKARSRKKAHE